MEMKYDLHHNKMSTQRPRKGCCTNRRNLSRVDVETGHSGDECLQRVNRTQVMTLLKAVRVPTHQRHITLQRRTRFDEHYPTVAMHQPDDALQKRQRFVI